MNRGRNEVIIINSVYLQSSLDFCVDIWLQACTVLKPLDGSFWIQPMNDHQNINSLESDIVFAMVQGPLNQGFQDIMIIDFLLFDRKLCKDRLYNLSSKYCTWSLERMMRSFCLSTGMNLTFSYYRQIRRDSLMAMLISVAGCLKIEISVFIEIYLARAFIQDTTFQKLVLFSMMMLRNFWTDLLIKDGGMSSPHIGGASATHMIFRDVQ